MIVECPACKTSHSKSEKDVAGSVPILCRRCGRSFRLTEAKTTELIPPPPTERTSGFDNVPTSLLNRAALADQLAAMKAPESELARQSEPEPQAELQSLEPIAVPEQAEPMPELAREDATLVKHAAGRRPSADWPPGDSPTGMMKAEALQERLAEMRQAESAGVSAPAEEPGPFGGAPVEASDDMAASESDLGATHLDTPLEELSAPKKRKPTLSFHFPWRPASVELRGLFLRQPWSVRAALAAVVVLPWLLLVTWLIASLGEDIELAYARQAASLLRGPKAGGAYGETGTLEQGERVRVYGREGDFVLVRDAMGRAGYVSAEHLSEDAVPSTPDRRFAECQRAPVESDITRCQGRAQEQFDSCRSVCGKDGDETACLEHCQKRFGDCMRTCEGEAATFPAPSTKEPKMTEPDPPAEVPVAKAEEPVRKKKIAPKKKKRGR